MEIGPPEPITSTVNSSNVAEQTLRANIAMEAEKVLGKVDDTIINTEDNIEHEIDLKLNRDENKQERKRKIRTRKACETLGQAIKNAVTLKFVEAQKDAGDCIGQVIEGLVSDELPNAKHAIIWVGVISVGIIIGSEITKLVINRYQQRQQNRVDNGKEGLGKNDLSSKLSETNGQGQFTSESRVTTE